MKRILYTATDSTGKDISNYINTNSNKEAIELLLEKGFSNIRFHDDIVTAIGRENLDGLSSNELEKAANFEVAIRLKPSFFTFMKSVFRKSKNLIIVLICIILFGILEQNNYYIYGGLILILLVPIVSMWSYRVVNRYDKLIRAYATGDIENITLIIGSLRKHFKKPEMAFDLDIRMAAINALNGDVKEEIIKIEKWRSVIDELSPGMYEMRISSIYGLNGSYDKALNCVRDAYSKSNQSPMMTLDLVLAEARLGDIEKAEDLLKEVRLEELPVLTVPFFNWAEGMIKYRKSSSNSEEKLLTAVSGFLDSADNPAFWPSLAVCVGDYAISVKSEPSIEKSEKLLSLVWEVLKFHGDKHLIKQLIDKYPNFKNE